MQVSQTKENMASKIANNGLCYGSTMFTNIFIDGTRMNIFQIYKKTVINLHMHNINFTHCFKDTIVNNNENA